MTDTLPAEKSSCFPISWRKIAQKKLYGRDIDGKSSARLRIWVQCLKGDPREIGNFDKTLCVLGDPTQEVNLVKQRNKLVSSLQVADASSQQAQPHAVMDNVMSRHK